MQTFYKIATVIGFIGWSVAATAQDKVPDTKPKKVVVARPDTVKYSTYKKGMVTATISAGFVDLGKQAYSVPSGYEKNDITGFLPLYGRLEYALTEKWSIGIAFVYQTYHANFYQLYEANGRTYRRSNSDQVNVFNANLFAGYHFGHLVHISRLDPFVVAGLGTNTISHTHKPQGDTTATIKEYKVTPFVRAGVRYFLSKRGSLFGDIGYDEKAILTLGFSCRLDRK